MRDPAGSDFAAVYRRHLHSTLAVVIALRGARVGVEEVAQEAFTRAFERWDDVGQMARPDLWIHRVALNLATSRLRRLGAEARAVARLGNRRDEPTSAAFVDHGPFWEAVRQLPPRQARVIALRYAADLPIADVAAVMGIAEGTVKAHVHAAKRRLEELLYARGDQRRGSRHDHDDRAPRTEP